MTLSSLVARAALRHSSRFLPTPRIATSAFHPYPLPTNISRNDDLPETPIAQPEPFPRTPETRPLPGRDSEPPSQVATPTSSAADVGGQKPRAARPRTKLRPRKAAMRLTPAAVERLRILLDQPEPKLIKVGVRNRGCSGLAYHLEYVDKPGAFDETVEQDGVTVLIDSKALFSIIGSEMDWAEDKLNQRFVFKNPNIRSGRSSFEKRVWTALCEVPRGCVTTYGLLSAYLGSSPRAVGNALRRNPFAPHVPCHRVVATGMTLGGFKGKWPRNGEGITLDEKRRLLKSEGIRFDEKGRVLGTAWMGWA
ncbi:hypothetical protein CP533_5759 [Ophiocordyceps camponoti-saundersi (nom. inval.)]|nr:hypothetical protein CP533_5759 [Ophiocordyceps camponoti-saundersi (nom. inval.)]